MVLDFIIRPLGLTSFFRRLNSHADPLLPNQPLSRPVYINIEWDEGAWGENTSSLYKFNGSFNQIVMGMYSPDALPSPNSTVQPAPPNQSPYLPPYAFVGIENNMIVIWWLMFYTCKCCFMRREQAACVSTM